ncbi:MAG: acyl-CoA dehydrogenase family protein, partial [Xanthobacteraceae bacterium]
FEAMECLGGNGYVEENMMPRLYREAPVNAIWEGSGNVMCLDVLRALGREDGAALVASLVREAGASAAIDPARFETAGEDDARRTVGRLALLASAAALRTSAPAAVADAFVQTRIAASHSPLYGAAEIDSATVETLLQRVLPEH